MEFLVMCTSNSRLVLIHAASDSFESVGRRLERGGVPKKSIEYYSYSDLDAHIEKINTPDANKMVLVQISLQGPSWKQTLQKLNNCAPKSVACIFLGEPNSALKDYAYRQHGVDCFFLPEGTTVHERKLIDAVRRILSRQEEAPAESSRLHEPAVAC